MEAEDKTTDAPAVEPTKKRGRPRKQPAPEEAKPVVEETQDRPKRGRGRPKKEAVKKEEEEVKEEEEEEEKPTKRPRRAQKSAEKAPEPSDEEEEKDAGEITSEEDEKPKKGAKKGAKKAAPKKTAKKSKGDSDEDDGESSEDSDAAKKPAKKSKAKKEVAAKPSATVAAASAYPTTCAAYDGSKHHKIISFNVNGIRGYLKNVKDGLHKLAEAETPDVICIQETKADGTVMAELKSVLSHLGYEMFESSGERKGYAGTAVFTKLKPLNVTYGIGKAEHDNEGRTITLEFADFILINTYIPNSGQKLDRLSYRTKNWDVDFRAFIKSHDAKKPVVWCGDLNVCHKEIDLFSPKTNKKTAGFTVEERASFDLLLAEGFYDSYRDLYPTREHAYTWWTPRFKCREQNKGWRLDYFVCSNRLKPRVVDSYILSNVEGSDHCPIGLVISK